MSPIQASVANLYNLNAQNASRAKSLSNITKAASKGEEKKDANTSSYNLDISEEGKKALESQIAVKKNDNEKTGSGGLLSKKAEDFLAKLKEKYGDYDLFVAEDLDDENVTAGATKKYSVVFKPEELEKMAEDEEYAEKVMGKVDEAIGITKRVEESGELGEGVSFKKISIKIDDEGNMKMFAELEKMSEAQMKRLEEQKAKRAEEKAKEAKAAEKADEENSKEDEEPLKVKRTKIEATSEEELLEMIKGIKWDEIEEEEM